MGYCFSTKHVFLMTFILLIYSFLFVNQSFVFFCPCFCHNKTRKSRLLICRTCFNPKHQFPKIAFLLKYFPSMVIIHSAQSLFREHFVRNKKINISILSSFLDAISFSSKKSFSSFNILVRLQVTTFRCINNFYRIKWQEALGTIDDKSIRLFVYHETYKKIYKTYIQNCISI